MRKHSMYTHYRGTGSWEKKRNGKYLQWCQLGFLASSNRVRKRDINDKYWMKESAEVKIGETA